MACIRLFLMDKKTTEKPGTKANPTPLTNSAKRPQKAQPKAAFRLAGPAAFFLSLHFLSFFAMFRFFPFWVFNSVSFVQKAVFPLIFIFYGAFGARGQCWEWQNPLPQDNPLNDVFFIDNQTGWAVGNYGTILKSTDSGQTWKKQNSGTSETLHSVFFTNIQTGWAVGYGVRLKTTNGGQTWSVESVNFGVYPYVTPYNLLDIYFIDSQIGWIATGFGGKLFFTLNGGGSWQFRDVNTDAEKVFFTNPQEGWFVGSEGIFKTSDGGLTWVNKFSNNLINLYSIAFANSNIGWAIGTNIISYQPIIIEGIVLKTTDNGETWSQQTSFYSQPLYDIFFADTQNGWLVGEGGYISKTTDGGASWIKYQTGTTSALKSVHGISNQMGWIVGGTAIFRTSNGTNWNQISTGTGQDIQEINFFNNQTGIAIGKGGVVAKTTNGGQAWILKNSGTTEDILGEYFLDNQLGWAIGNGIMLKTTNAGESWSIVNSTISGNDLVFRDELVGWRISSNGIKETNDGGTTWKSAGGGGGISGTDIQFDQTYCVGWASGFQKTTDCAWSWQDIFSAPNIFHFHFLNENLGWGTQGKTIYKTLDGGETWSMQESNRHDLL